VPWVYTTDEPTRAILLESGNFGTPDLLARGLRPHHRRSTPARADDESIRLDTIDLPLLPYHAPGDDALGPYAERMAEANRALLLSNHGPIVAGASLSAATDALEELEETARLFLLLHGRRTRPLTREQVAAVRGRV